ncbi:MAG: hypothetical protein AAGK04_05480 [Planctomycetota bacterium]
MPGLDGKELTTALKAAKKKPRNFLFAAGSKLEDHYLDLSKKKIPKSRTKEAKAAAGAPKAYTGVVEFDKNSGELQFKTAVGFADKQSKALRMLVKKRAGLTSLTPVLKLVEDLKEQDFEDEEEGAAASGAPGMGVGNNTPSQQAPSQQAQSQAPQTQEVRPGEDQPDANEPPSPETQDVRPGEDQPDPVDDAARFPDAPMDEKAKAEILKDVAKIQKEIEQIAKTLKLSL